MIQPFLRALRVWRPLLAAAAVGTATLAGLLPTTAQAVPSWQSTDQLGGYLTADGNTVKFRVISERATRLEVFLYRQATGAAAVNSQVMTKVAGTSIWEASFSASALRSQGFTITPTSTTALFTDVFYGYRAWGPNWTYNASWTPGSSLGFVSDVDSQGNRFNPNKLLLDPYALETTHDYITAGNPLASAVTDPTLYTSGATNRNRDSALQAPKGIVAMPSGAAFAALNFGTKPTRALKDDIIYEAHLRGLTMGDSSVGTCKGTYQGAIAKIPYLQSLGITAIEFMPLHESDNEANDLNNAATGRSSTSTKDDNYWGYMTINFFAPDRRYACDKSVGGPTRELVKMVKAFHDAGIKVVADVVYNHTAEGGLWALPGGGPDFNTANVWSMRGLDNQMYYLTKPNSAAEYENHTGLGQTTNTHHPKVANLILDSMHYLHKVWGIDGFRFDLGLVLANSSDNTTPQRFTYSRTDPSTALAKAVAAFPNVLLSSEPWSTTGYEMGNMPPGISEWNGLYRDSMRTMHNKYGQVEEDGNATRSILSSRIAGSQDLYGDAGDGRNLPRFSINMLNVHDGMTLKDVFSCNKKKNDLIWPEGPSDGGADYEHPWDNMQLESLQQQQARMGFAMLMLSAGVPIFNAGDEFLRAMRCNNNAYNVDSPFTWLDYGPTNTAGTSARNFREFATRMIAFRKSQPALRPTNFYASNENHLSASAKNNMAQLDWFSANNAYRTDNNLGNFWGARPNAPDSDGQNRTMAWRYDSSELGGSAPILVLFNGEPVDRNFKFPWTGPGKTTWCRVTDTAPWAEGLNQVDWNPAVTTPQIGVNVATTCLGGENTNYVVAGRSLVVLIAK